MDYTVHDYRKEKGFKEANEAFQKMVSDIESSFNGNVKVEARFGKGVFQIDLHPVVPLDQHAYIAFIAKVFEHANVAIQSDADDDNDDFGHLLIKSLSGMVGATKGSGGLGSANAQALLAALNKAGGLTSRNEGKLRWKIKHVQVWDRNSELVEAFKNTEEAKISLEPCIPKGFDWGSAYIRIPKD